MTDDRQLPVPEDAALPEARRRLSEIVAAALPRGGMAVVNAILEQKNAVELIQSLDAEELHALVLDIGKGDAVDLLRHASDEQFQGLLDIESWVGERFVPERLEEWMGIAAAAGADTFARLVESMDDETIGLYLLRRGRIVQRIFDADQEDEIPDQGEVFTTPDGLFFVVLPHGSPHFAAVRELIEGLYVADKEEAISLIRTIVMEDADILEEESVRFRNARIRSMGFPGPEDITKLYAYLNPVRARQRIRTRLAHLAEFDTAGPTLLPALIGLDFATPPFLRTVLDGLDVVAVRARIAQAVAYLVNAVFMRESEGDLGNADRLPQAAHRAVGLLNLALEYVSDGSPQVGREILTRIWPKTLFRIGHSLTIMVREQARRLLPLAGEEHGFFLFDPPLDDVIRGAAQPLAQYFEGLDDEAQAGWRDLLAVRDVTRTKAALKQAAEVAAYAQHALAVTVESLAPMVPKDIRPAVTHTTLMATALMNSVLGRTRLVQPLSLADIASVADLVLMPDADGARRLNPRLRTAMQQFAAAEKNRFAAALLDLSLRKLEDLFQRLPRGTPPDSRFVAGTLLIK